MSLFQFSTNYFYILQLRKEFEKRFAPIEEFVQSDKVAADERAKIAASVISFANEINSYISKGQTAYTILKNYAPKKYGQIERNRKNQYIGDFKVAGSKAEALVKQYHDGELLADDLLVCLIETMKQDGKLKNVIFDRQSLRAKAAIYKLIQDNYETFENCFKEGYRFESGE